MGNRQECDRDRVHRRVGSGLLEVRINGRVYRIDGGLREIRVYTQGDERDSVTILGDIGDVHLNVERSVSSMLNNVKVDETMA